MEYNYALQSPSTSYMVYSLHRHSGSIANDARDQDDVILLR